MDQQRERERERERKRESERENIKKPPQIDKKNDIFLANASPTDLVAHVISLSFFLSFFLPFFFFLSKSGTFIHLVNLEKYFG